MKPFGQYPYEQTVVTAPIAPSAEPFDLTFNAPLIREIWAERIIDEPMMSQDFTSARSFFRGNDLVQDQYLLRYIRYGQKIIIPVYKDQNPLSLYQRQDLTYDEIDACREQLKLNCTMPCINTLPEIDNLEVAFDHEYAWGVRACDKNKDFWDFEFFSRQYGKSKGGYELGRELDMWNTVMTSLIAAPATTVDVAIATDHPTHYWDNLGDIALTGRHNIGDAYEYLVNAYSDIRPTIFMTKEGARALIESVENPYNLNFSNRVVNTFREWYVPGYQQAEAVKEILGLPDAEVVIVKRSPWVSGTDFNKYPLWNEDRTSQYVAILDPRVGYDFEIDGYHLTIQPYDCDKLIRGMIDSVYVAMGTTFPQYGMVLEFDGPSATPAGPITEIAFGTATAEIAQGSREGFDLTVTPANGTGAITFEVTSAPDEGSVNDITLTASSSGRHVNIAVGTEAVTGDYTITATAGEATAVLTITVTDSE